MLSSPQQDWHHTRASCTKLLKSTFPDRADRLQQSIFKDYSQTIRVLELIQTDTKPAIFSLIPPLC